LPARVQLRPGCPPRSQCRNKHTVSTGAAHSKASLAFALDGTVQIASIDVAVGINVKEHAIRFKRGGAFEPGRPTEKVRQDVLIHAEGCQKHSQRAPGRYCGPDLTATLGWRGQRAWMKQRAARTLVDVNPTVGIQNGNADQGGVVEDRVNRRWGGQGVGGGRSCCGDSEWQRRSGRGC
jgi:hypothetical protein